MEKPVTVANGLMLTQCSKNSALISLEIKASDNFEHCSPKRRAIPSFASAALAKINIVVKNY
jgi:hypothetical protein